MMNDILHSFISQGVVICYMDNILIFMETLTEHHCITQEVLATLCQHRLFLKPEKCKFECQEIDYLGLQCRSVIVDISVAKNPTIKTVYEALFYRFLKFWQVGNFFQKKRKLFWKVLGKRKMLSKINC